MLGHQSTQATLETDCDAAHAQALCELDAESEAERVPCGDTSLNESESQISKTKTAISHSVLRG